MSIRKHLRLVFALAAAAAVLGFTAAPASASDDGECKPPCFKHPITGQLICGHPCP
ncbi:uncharacterized protein SOCEGT47_007800 [Sorangium cellulosum]|uniref:Secreted protein n=1 Tax=Sorangium cellulosum TaxID=56 RepID=A0A4V0NCT7_SORCE|nr:hypothetical protein [Sorangium cellulosum]AUX20312.1 uncharacterized protein SOCEGT47_007800 [Sorangium cellulosum]